MTKEQKKLRDELMSLMRDNPNLPVIPFVNGGGEWGNTYWQGDIKDVEIGDVEGVGKGIYVYVDCSHEYDY